MKQLYEGYVVSQNEQPVVINEPIECESLEEYIDTVTSLITDAAEELDPEAEYVVEKLLARDFELELDSDGEVDYVYVTVRA